MVKKKQKIAPSLADTKIHDCPHFENDIEPKMFTTSLQTFSLPPDIHDSLKCKRQEGNGKDFTPVSN